jgi:hypothetical protein
MASKHEYNDICITGVKLSDYETNKLQILIDTSKDEEENFNKLFLNKQDIAELGRWLGLVVYEKDSRL